MRLNFCFTGWHYVSIGKRRTDICVETSHVFIGPSKNIFTLGNAINWFSKSLLGANKDDLGLNLDLGIYL